MKIGIAHGAPRRSSGDLEIEYWKVGWGDPAYVHDEERELFRFRDARFAFSREHADWALLRKRGCIKGL